MSRLDAVLAVSLMLASAGAAGAQEATIPSEEDWGTTTSIYHPVVAHEFQLAQGTEGTTDFQTLARACTGGSCTWLGGVHLPSGAQILSLDVSACDNSATGEIRFGLKTVPRTPGPAPYIVNASTGVATANGCLVTQVPLSSPRTVDNVNNGYALQVSADIGNVSWTQLRVRYRLQVSAAPSVASFPLDVPTTHPFFRFVEAMESSGLTGGCAAGRFCPDAPVTRGQISVFLASALGLHFPN